MEIPKQDTPRKTTTIEFQCYAPEEYGYVWEDVPDEYKKEIEAHGGMPCEGQLAVGWWCKDCRFGGWQEV